MLKLDPFRTYGLELGNVWAPSTKLTLQAFFRQSWMALQLARLWFALLVTVVIPGLFCALHGMVVVLIVYGTGLSRSGLDCCSTLRWNLEYLLVCRGIPKPQKVAPVQEVKPCVCTWNAESLESGSQVPSRTVRLVREMVRNIKRAAVRITAQIFPTWTHNQLMNITVQTSRIYSMHNIVNNSKHSIKSCSIILSDTEVIHTGNVLHEAYDPYVLQRKLSLWPMYYGGGGGGQLMTLY